MTYNTFIHEAVKRTIGVLDSGIWYLDPQWLDIISRNLLSDLTTLTDSYVTTWDQVEDILKLEVERRNKLMDNSRFVTDWFFDLITSQIDPAMIQEENNLVKDILKYMQEKELIKTEEKPEAETVNP